MIEYNGKEYDDYHGGPFDRGMADSWYRRSRKPHCYGNFTGGQLVDEANMTEEQVEAYNAGFDFNEENGDFKDFG